MALHRDQLDGLGADRTISRTHDACGNPTEELWDQDDNGVPDWGMAWEIQYLDACRPLRISADRGLDGEADWVEQYEYSPDAQAVRILTDDRDADGAQYQPDGVIDSIVARDYDDMGRLVREAADENADGAADLTLTLAYDDEGRIIAKTQEAASPERVTWAWAYEYVGNLMIETVTNSLGPVHVVRHQRDDHGNTMHQDTWGPAGVIQRREIYDYDCWDQR